MLQRSVPQASTHSMQQQVGRAVGRGLLILIVIWTLIALAGLVLLTVFDRPSQTLGPGTAEPPDHPGVEALPPIAPSDRPDETTASVGQAAVEPVVKATEPPAAKPVVEAADGKPRADAAATVQTNPGRPKPDRATAVVSPEIGSVIIGKDSKLTAAGSEPEVEEAAARDPEAAAGGTGATPDNGGPPPETGELSENGEPGRDPAELPENGGAEHIVGLPVYPWPPEDPSSLVRLDVLYDFRHGGRASLQDVADQLAAALNESGYLEQSFYQTSGGFVMVTRLEGIAEDGTPLGAERRYLLPNDRVDFSFADYIRSLFFAPEGYYRFVAFVITDRPYTTSEDGLEEHDALGRLRRGAVALPAGFDQRPFSAEHRVDALIYEFSQQSEGVIPLRPGRLPPRTHLEKSGLMSALAAAGAGG